MAKKDWDFECPQFVDFEKELDSSGKSDIFFEAKDKSAGSLSTPEVQGKGKGLTDSDENRLLGKMTAALSLLTPKVKKNASKNKLFPESVFKTKASKSTVKPNTVPAPQPRSRRSKSLDHLNKIVSKKTNTKSGMRKSSSLNDLRIHKKMKNYPVTPMCLKRTIFKAKAKIARKTTEEMELEQIAKLQKQLKEHLRQNEISLKKLNLRPRQCTASNFQRKTNNFKDIKGAGVHAEKSNVAEKEPRRNVGLMSQTGVKKDISKPDAIIKCKNVSNDTTEIAVCPRKSKAHSVSDVKTDVKVPALHHTARKEASKLNATTSNIEAASSRNTIYSSKGKSPSVLDGINSSTQKTKRLVHKKIFNHSGLFFVPSVKCNAVKPLISDEENKENPQAAGVRLKEASALNLKECNDKENKSSIRPRVSKKSQGTQNAKCDINKLNDSSKITGKRTANPRRGTPLAENVCRN